MWISRSGHSRLITPRYDCADAGDQNVSKAMTPRSPLMKIVRYTASDAVQIRSLNGTYVTVVGNM